MNMKALLLLALIVIASSHRINQVIESLRLELDDILYSRDGKQLIQFEYIEKCSYLQTESNIRCDLHIAYEGNVYAKTDRETLQVNVSIFIDT
jgi:hypothetical protein